MPDQKKNEVMEIKLLEWAKEYGLCYTLSTPFMGKLIVISDSIMIWSILFNFHQYPKTEDYFFVAPIIGERSMVMAGREEWANMRKAFNPGFEPSFLKTMVTVIEDKLARFLDGIDEDIKADNPTNMLARSQSFTSDVIVAIAFGEDWGGSKPHPALGWVHELTSRCLKFAFDPYLQLFGFSEWRKVKYYEKLLDQEMMNLLERRIAAAKSEPSQGDLCSIAVEQMKQGYGSLTRYDKISITHQLKTFYSCGYENASTIVWAVWLLSQNTHVLSKVRAELQAQTVWTENSTPPSYDQLQKCHYLGAVIKETLRLYPPASMVSRVATNTMHTCNGWRVGGATIILSLFVMHHHPNLWNEPEVFRPERFVDGSEDNMVFKFLPFSIGPRDCIGKHVVILEAMIALSAIIMRYDMTCVDPNENIVAEPTLKPKNGAHVKFTHRK